MNILYITNDTGVAYLAVSLESLLINNREEKVLDIYVVDDGITEKNKTLLCEEGRRYRRELHFINKPDISVLMGVNVASGKWPDNIFCRLFTPTLFQNNPEVRRIIYLDTDTVVASSLSKLWKTEMDNYSCAAVLECMSNLHKKAVGLDYTTPYFNSGMMLIDLNKWEEQKIEEKCRKIAREYVGSIEYPDEGIVNAAIKGHFKILHPKYNLTTLKAVFSYDELRTYRKSSVMYTKKEYEEAIENPVVIHYTNSFIVDRPWVCESKYPHIFAGLWVHYKSKSLWKNWEPVKTWKNMNIRRLIENILHCLPRKIVIYFMGIIYCYLKPLKYMKKRSIN